MKLKQPGEPIAMVFGFEDIKKLLTARACELLEIDPETVNARMDWNSATMSDGTVYTSGAYITLSDKPFTCPECGGSVQCTGPVPRCNGCGEEYPRDAAQPMVMDNSTCQKV